MGLGYATDSARNWECHHTWDNEASGAAVTLAIEINYSNDRLPLRHHLGGERRGGWTRGNCIGAQTHAVFRSWIESCDCTGAL